MKLFKTVAVIIILFAAISNLQAQSGDKIRIILQQPPPGKFGVVDIWSISLTNTTNENLTIHVGGTASEEKDGLIIEAKSKPFTIKPGTTKYKHTDFSSAEIKYNNGKYKEILMRTGNAPEGNYTICVTAYSESGEVIGQENCITQSVQQLGSISLISPSDGEKLDTKMPINFTWTPLPKAETYKLRIVELKGDQSPEVAMRSNQPIFEKELRTTTYQGDPIHGIDVKLGMKYAWQVTSGEVVSEVWGFSMTSCGTLEIITKVECSQKEPGKYDYTITCFNPSNDAACIMTINNPIALSSGTINTISVTLPQDILAGQTLTITGTLTTSANGNFIISVTGPEFTGNYTPSYSLIKCNCCEGVIKQISQQLNSDGTKLTTDIKVGPNKIKQVRMNLVYVNSVTDKNCPVCKSNSAYWGNFNWGDWYWVDDPSRPGIIKFGNPADIHHRELTWVDNNGIDMYNTQRRLELGLLLDEVLISSGVLKKCCKTELNFCIRYSFTDTACVTCDTVLCSKFVYGGNDLPRDDTIRTNYKDVEMLMKLKMQNKEYQKDGEGQGEKNIAFPTLISFKINQNDSLKLPPNEKPEKYSVMPCYEQHCSTDSLIINTGYNSSNNSLYNFGDDDGYWELVDAPFGISMPRPVKIIDKNVAWVDQTNTRWISAFAFENWAVNNRPDETDPNDPNGGNFHPYTFQRCFCVCDSNTMVTLDFTYMVDNAVKIFLDNTLITDEYNIDNTKTFKYPDTVKYTSSLNKGKHCLKFEVRNLSGVAMGLNVKGTIKGMHLLTSNCCDNMAWIMGRKIWDKNCNGQFEDAETGLEGIVVKLNNGISTVTDSHGEFIFKVAPGDYTVTELLPTGWTMSFPSSGSHTISLAPNEIVNNLLFLNCGDGNVQYGNTCCDRYTTNVTSNIDPITKDKIRVRFTAGPNRIKRVIADIIDFTVTHNDDVNGESNCDPCVPNSDQWGNFKNTPTSITGLDPGKLTVPSGSTSGFSREIVWGNLNGPGINMTGGTPWLNLPLSLPSKHSSSCCVDTIKFCVRYKFMDTTCVECDTVICYRIIRKGNIIMNNKEEKFEGMDLQEKNNETQIINSSGQSAGIINLDLQNKSEVKITIYDAGGKEKMKIYDDYMNSGQYSFDLNKYNLPDGVYFYRIKAGSISKYEKVMITKPTSGCNCGH